MAKNKLNSGLGLTKDLADIGVDDLKDNPVAINIILHNCQRLENENTMLKQDLNRQATIERTLSERKAYTKIAAIVSIFGTILLSFGINFVTANSRDVKGIILIILGIIAHIISLYFSFKGDEE